MEFRSTSRKRVRVDNFIPLLRNSFVMIQSAKMEGFLRAHTM